MIVSFIILFTVVIISGEVSARTDASTAAGSVDCYDGAYRVPLPPFDNCSGYRKCEIGHYCENGIKNMCPSGFYGSSPGLNSSLCSGLCPAGFYCPQGSSAPLFCGDTNKYCPVGSSSPLAVPDGYFSLDLSGNTDPESKLTRSSIQICPRGHHCSNGTKTYCPGGTYGSTEGLSIVFAPNCSGSCPEGWYCPSGSIDPFAFSCSTGSDSGTTFCPAGSERPIPTAEGYYAVNPHSTTGGGFGAQVICPRGSYCLQGQRHLCPGGTFGPRIRETNPQCAGECSPGFYCPAGSIHTEQVQCPDAASYCPRGSAAPIPVTIGYYTVGHFQQDYVIEPTDGYFTVGNDGIGSDGKNYSYTVSTGLRNKFAETARSGQAICEAGYYCLSDGIKRKCPVGRYGSSAGLSTASCSGYCAAGYYCEEGSPLERQYVCGGADRFCPPGSPAARPVHPGYYTVQLQDEDPAKAAAERRCEPGFYCVAGIKRVCDRGTWGGEFGLVRYCSSIPVPIMLRSKRWCQLTLSCFICSHFLDRPNRSARAHATPGIIAPWAACPPRRSSAAMRTSTAPAETTSPSACLKGIILLVGKV
jgi:hypothetical protein